MRGTGTTTQQLKAAPQGALFIWCTRNTGYPKGLAERLGRKDIHIRGTEALDDPHGVMALEYSAVIVDHAVKSSVFRHQSLVQLLHRTRPSVSCSMIELHQAIARNISDEAFA